MKNWLRSPILLGLTLLLLLSLLFAVANWDLTVSAWFFREGWPLGDQQPWRFLYYYGTLPGLLLSAAALMAWAGGRFWPAWRRWQRPAAVILVTLLLGPGLLVNVLGKGYWGRPRPRDTSSFGGTQPFHRFTQPGVPGQGKSFPSGHPSVGYLFCVFFFLDPSRRRRWAWLGAGLGYGTLMGIGRMAEGAHFASDVLWSGGLTYLSAAAASALVRAPGVASNQPLPERAGRLRAVTSTAAVAVALPLLAAFFLLATPYYKEWKATVAGPPDVTSLRLQLPSVPETVRVAPARQTPALIIQAGLHGFGFPKLRLEGDVQSVADGTTLTAICRLDLRGWVAERGGEIQFLVRHDLCLDLETAHQDGDLRLGESSLPGRYGTVQVDSRRGGILFLCSPGSIVSGGVYLTSERGDIRAEVDQLADPGPHPWFIETRQGTALIRVAQSSRLRQPLDVRAHTLRGEVALSGKVHEPCEMSVQWDEGQGRLGLQAGEGWVRSGKRIDSVHLLQPDINVILTTATGTLAVELAPYSSAGFTAQQPSSPAWTGSPAAAPVALRSGEQPTPETASSAEAAADAAREAPTLAAPTAEANPADELEWVKRELVTLPSSQTRISYPRFSTPTAKSRTVRQKK